MHVLVRDPCIFMHEAKVNRAEADTDNRQTEDGTLRAAISSATAAPGVHEQLFRAPLRLRGRLEQPFRAPLRHRGGLEQPFRAPLRLRAGSNSHFERPCGSERARAAISSAPAGPSGRERLFERPSEAERARAANLSARPFRAPQRGRAGSSGHFERLSEAAAS